MSSCEEKIENVSQFEDVLPEEVWVPHFEDPDYEVSSYGNVRSVKRFHGKRILRVLKKIDNGSGYFRLYLSIKGRKSKWILCQTLVAQHFKGPNPDIRIYTVDHVDKNKANNHISNLNYATRYQQCENRDHFKNYIRGTKWGTYNVRFQSNPKFNMTYKTEAEAIAKRDEILATRLPVPLP